ncbi:enoyl-CoA hydratase [Parafrankia irregularis]|uniref:Enoyl-CoA hydratase n=1 Tax=Parafrankia irregularis TaxID=795642 RepID=A0A0S4QS24_9ACTN|nr:MULTISPECIES: enoyl-CoA hydratase [Parafrankia]MBE3204587.1 enoyl-CoA hydratase [Parafrankia sp. CH37]CUU58439.1 enoyl-CoA hydratase [Parafrankia irregularis]
MPAANEPVVLVETQNRVTTVTLNRPAARNALSRELLHLLWDAVLAAGADPDVDAVVLTGADPAFSAGVDLKELSGEAPSTTPPREAGQGQGRYDNGLYRFLPVIDKPIIGAINGVAATGGLELALQCTFLVASERARFADTHARVGIMPGGGITVLLAQSIGLRRAIEMSLTGNYVAAPEALRLGLVNHVVPHEELLPFAQRLAGDIVSNDARGVRRLVAHYRQVANAATLDDAHRAEGLLAETWRPDTSNVAARRAAVTERGRSQTQSGTSPA